MRWRARFLGKAVLVLAVVALAAAVVMELWNTVVTGALTGAHPLDYAHALGLLVLCRLLFGGFRGRSGWHRARWEKWQAMTPEEREAVSRRWGGGGCGRAAQRGHHAQTSSNRDEGVGGA